MYDHNEVEHASNDLMNGILRARRLAMRLVVRFNHDAPPPPSSPSPSNHPEEEAESDGSATDFNPNTNDDNNSNNNDNQPPQSPLPDNELQIIHEIIDGDNGQSSSSSTNHRVRRGHQCRRRRVRVCRRPEVTDVDVVRHPVDLIVEL
ncbi:uncharacterized protein LOC142326599 [Lycorma delicatula]|uniref:uncharacterized protein LOC142326599 n=1 Tax=Lycorma delicatula TaxID=130591 RepID=UPI003F515A0C